MNSRCRCWPPILAFFAWIITSPLYASDVWTLPLFSADPSQVYDDAQKFRAPPDSDLYLIELNINVHIDDRGRVSRTRRGVWRVLTDAGAKQLATWTEPWPAWREQKPALQLRVITSDKKAHALDPATITVAGLPGVNELYSDVQVMQAPLPAIAANSVVEFEVITGDREVVIPGQRFDRLALAIPASTHHFAVQLQSATKLSAMARGFETIDHKDADNQSQSFEAWDLPRFENKPLRPPELPAAPEIVFSTASSWQSIARWYQQATEPLFGAYPSTDELAEPERSHKIAAVLADVQKNVRYTGLELGLSAFVPHSAEETWKRGYGDCKDKATLLVSRLRKEGIRAELALITPYPFSEVAAELPGLEAFNHVIVYVPGKQPLWIDPTSKYTPATRLPLVDLGRNALIVDPASTGLVRTPASVAGQNRVLEEITVKVQPQGKADLDSVETYAGTTEDLARTTFASILASPDSKSKLEEQLKKQLRLDSLASLDSSPLADLGQSFQLKYSGRGWELGTTQVETADVFLTLGQQFLGSLAQLLVADTGQGAKEKKAARTEDYFLGATFDGEIQYVLLPPSGFRLKRLPELSKIDFGPVRLSFSTSVRPDNAVLVKYALFSDRARYTVAEAEQIAAGIKKLRALPLLHLEFVDQVHELLASGKEKEALALARQRVTTDPQSAGALVRLAATLSAVGANPQAIEICRKATTLDPKSAAAFSELADLYSRDDVGRQFHLGLRYLDAIEAFQHAIELDPKDAKLKLKLAILYQHDAKGAHYSKNARLTDAIATLHQIEADLPKLKSPGALPEVLLFNRQYADVKKFYEDDTSAAPLSYRLAALAVTDGVEAVRKAFDTVGVDASRQSQFTSAAQYLIFLHEYAAAAQLLREAMQDENENTRSEIAMLAKTRRREDAQFSKEPPIALVEHLIYALLDPDDDQGWKQLYVPEWRDLAVRTERNDVLGMLRSWRIMGQASLGWAIVADLAVSNAQFVSDGSDETGYRVRIPDASNNGAMKTVAWIVKRGDGYQVLGLGPGRATAAGAALEAAQKGDLKSAKQWLDWLREEITVPGGADPLAGLAFPKLWPVPKAGAVEMINAAASVVVRGKYFETALPALLEAEKNSKAGVYRDAIDLAIVHCYNIHQQWANAVSEAKELHQEFPESEVGLDMLLTVLLNSDLDAARKLVADGLAKDPQSAVSLRAQYRLSDRQEDYETAVDAMRKVTRTAKVTAVDWNNLAWISLLANDTGTSVLEAAGTANRLTQSRNASYLHTLGCVEALQGDTAGARKALFQYMDLGSGSVDDSGKMLLGLIEEQLDLADAARENFEKLARPKFGVGGSSYALAQKRLAAMKDAPR